MAMPNDRTIIDEFENVLGVPFGPRWTKMISIDVRTARPLAQEVSRFYKGFRFPEKDRGEMRPYLFRRYTTGGKPWPNFVRFEGDKYTFTPFARHRSSRVPEAIPIVFPWDMFLRSAIGSARLFSTVVRGVGSREDHPAWCGAIAVGVRQDC